jgi:hypothetical protein
MSRKLWGALVALGLSGVAGAAHAGVSWSIGISAPVGFGDVTTVVSDGGYHRHAPVYVAPAPVYVAPPAPVYYAPPPPVYYAPPAPVYYAPPVYVPRRVVYAPVPVYVGPGYDHHHHHHHDWHHD